MENNEKMKKFKERESLIVRKKKKLKEEQRLNQEELVNFQYQDKINNKIVTIYDKRKIKVALMEFEISDLEYKFLKDREECRYNPKTDDPIDEEQDMDNIIEKQALERESIELNNESKFVRDLEDALQEVSNNLASLREEKKKILNFFKNNLNSFTQQQLMLVFMGYFLDLQYIEIANYLGIKLPTISIYFDRIKKKMAKLGLKSV